MHRTRDIPIGNERNHQGPKSRRQGHSICFNPENRNINLVKERSTEIRHRITSEITRQKSIGTLPEQLVQGLSEPESNQIANNYGIGLHAFQIVNHETKFLAGLQRAEQITKHEAAARRVMN